MFHLIGLGLNENSLTIEALRKIKKCRKIYLENYTVRLPYPIKKLEKIIKRKILILNREQIESMQFLREAKKQNIALLVYGSPLFATTHITLLEECQKQKIPYAVIFNASVFDGVAATGLQLYKFGKIASMPKWQKNYRPNSFVEYILENKKINSHSLILIDPYFDFQKALEQFEHACKNKMHIDKIIVCSQLGAKNQKILYGTIEQLQNKKISGEIRDLFCFIIPGKMHFVEEAFLDDFAVGDGNRSYSKKHKYSRPIKFFGYF